MMIVTFTDFGSNGPYMGQMKARLIDLAPNIPVIDLMVDAPSFNIKSSAKLLCGLLQHMPKGGVYLCVVDPGVGSSRKPVCINCDGQWFVGPDNGLFHYVLEKASTIDAFVIDWRDGYTSNSFHGRDLFAPVAAMLALDQAFAKTSIEWKKLERISETDISTAQILYIDDYGNCWTDILEKDLTETALLKFGNHTISYATVFSDTEEGELFWYYNSSGFVEIAANRSNAALLTGLKQGDPVGIN